MIIITTEYPKTPIPITVELRAIIMVAFSLIVVFIFGILCATINGLFVIIAWKEFGTPGTIAASAIVYALIYLAGL